MSEENTKKTETASRSRGYQANLMEVLATIFLRRGEPVEEVEQELLHILSPQEHPLPPKPILPR